MKIKSDNECTDMIFILCGNKNPNIYKKDYHEILSDIKTHNVDYLITWLNMKQRLITYNNIQSESPTINSLIQYLSEYKIEKEY
jgi:hypothetical protein